MACESTYNTTNVINVTDDDKNACLTELQRETTPAMIPAIVFLLLVAVVGVVGNTLVIFVYGRKTPRAPLNVLLVAIASFDLVANTVAIPGNIFDMLHVWDFNFPTLCRILKFSYVYTTIASAILLLAVSVIRYRKVCKPFSKQVNVKHAIILCVGIAIFSAFASVPFAVINGRRTKPTSHPQIFGYECSIDDSYVTTIWPMVNRGFFILMFLGCSISMCVLYSMIGVKAWRSGKAVSKGAKSTGLRQVTHTTSTTQTSLTDQKSTSMTCESSNNGITDDVKMNNGASPSGDTERVIEDKIKGNLNTASFLVGANADNRKMDANKVNEFQELNPISETDTIDLSDQEDDFNDQDLPRGSEKITIDQKTPKKSSSTVLTRNTNSPAIEQITKKVNKEDFEMTKNHCLSPDSELHTDQNKITVIGDITDNKTKSKVTKKTSSNTTKTTSDRRGIGKTTKMLIIISVTFIAGFVPNMGLATYKNTSPDKFASLSFIGQILFNLFFRSFFLNSVANPIIYSMCNINFRKDCLKLLFCNTCQVRRLYTL